jgi:hypothetical protein
MASTRQVRAAKQNIEKAQARRGGNAGHALEERNRQQLYEIAEKRNIPGRSKMGRWDLIDAIRGRR